MIVLGIDTSSRSESVAIIRDGSVLKECQNLNTYKPSTEIFPLIQKALAGSKLSLPEVDVLAISIGPGSFTGLRVGLALAKGLALSLEKPVIPVSSLEAMVRASGVQGLVAPMMDARRGEVYASIFEVEGEEIKRCTDEYAIEASEFCQHVSRKTTFLGEGAKLFSETITSFLGERADFWAKEPDLTIAGGVGLLGQQKFERGWCEDIDRLTPRYIRRSEAEIIRLKKKGVAAGV